jgi:hypothetical protein
MIFDLSRCSGPNCIHPHGGVALISIKVSRSNRIPFASFRGVHTDENVDWLDAVASPWPDRLPRGTKIEISGRGSDCAFNRLRMTGEGFRV